MQPFEPLGASLAGTGYRRLCGRYEEALTVSGSGLAVDARLIVPGSTARCDRRRRLTLPRAAATLTWRIVDGRHPGGRVQPTGIS